MRLACSFLCGCLPTKAFNLALLPISLFPRPFGPLITFSSHFKALWATERVAECVQERT